MNDNLVIDLARQFIEAAANNNVTAAKEIFYAIFNRFEDDVTQYPAQAFDFAVHCIRHPFAINDDVDMLEENGRDLTANEERILAILRRELNIPVLKAA